MSVYEYHPDELARLNVVRRASGLSLSQLREHWQAAQGREERALAAPQEPRKPTELDIASCQRMEWARIIRVMTERQMPVYSPDADPRVARREEQRTQRMAAEAAWDEHAAGGLPVEVLRHRVYRVTARQAGSSTGDLPLIRHIFAASGAAAVERAQAILSRPGSPYQDGPHRIISVEQVLPEPGEFF
ncbi:hypothetical protein ACFVZ4_20040 [Streptomyces goshikiensis]|uniref:hypothetical protein n=1 Tax=Streptomyces goshikiensis TaxID=1942 RepID=UPI003680F28F